MNSIIRLAIATFLATVLALVGCSGENSSPGTQSDYAEFLTVRPLVGGQRYQPYETLRFSLPATQVVDRELIYLGYVSLDGTEYRYKAVPVGRRGDKEYFTFRIPPVNTDSSSQQYETRIFAEDGSYISQQIEIDALPFNDSGLGSGEAALLLMETIAADFTRSKEEIEQYFGTQTERDEKFDLMMRQFSETEALYRNSVDRFRSLVREGIPLTSKDGSAILLSATDLNVLDRIVIALVDSLLVTTGDELSAKGVRSLDFDLAERISRAAPKIRDIGQLIGGVVSTAVYVSTVGSALVASAPVAAPVALVGSTFLVTTFAVGFFSGLMEQLPTFQETGSFDWRESVPTLKYVVGSYGALAINSALNLPLVGSVIINELNEIGEKFVDGAEAAVEIVEDIHETEPDVITEEFVREYDLSVVPSRSADSLTPLEDGGTIPTYPSNIELTFSAVITEANGLSIEPFVTRWCLNYYTVYEDGTSDDGGFCSNITAQSEFRIITRENTVHEVLVDVTFDSGESLTSGLVFYSPP